MTIDVPQTSNGTALPPATPAPAPLSTQPGPNPTLPAICSQLRAKVDAFLAAPPKDALVARVQAQTRVSLQVMEQAFRTYSYVDRAPPHSHPAYTPNRFDELAISFNGGKDCLVLLVLLLAAIPAPAAGARVRSVYVMSARPFAEVDDFVATCIATYALEMHRYPLPMKAAFASYLRENPSVKAIFVGTRRTDPHGELLGHFDPTDHGWPAFMRVQPVIDWHYQEVWTVCIPWTLRVGRDY